MKKLLLKTLLALAFPSFLNLANFLLFLAFKKFLTFLLTILLLIPLANIVTSLSLRSIIFLEWLMLVEKKVDKVVINIKINKAVILLKLLMN